MFYLPVLSAFPPHIHASEQNNDDSVYVHKSAAKIPSGSFINMLRTFLEMRILAWQFSPACAVLRAIPHFLLDRRHQRQRQTLSRICGGDISASRATMSRNWNSFILSEISTVLKITIHILQRQLKGSHRVFECGSILTAYVSWVFLSVLGVLLQSPSPMYHIANT